MRVVSVRSIARDTGSDKAPGIVDTHRAILVVRPHPFPYDRAMPHIRLIDPEDADGMLAEEYDAAVERAGKVFNIVRSMSLNPEVLKASIEMYKAIMFGPSPLTRQERELLATVVSAENECYY
jgi:Carboxymuconolactone decarboxylase family